MNDETSSKEYYCVHRRFNNKVEVTKIELGNMLNYIENKCNVIYIGKDDIKSMLSNMDWLNPDENHEEMARLTGCLRVIDGAEKDNPKGDYVVLDDHDPDSYSGVYDLNDAESVVQLIADVDSDNRFTLYTVDEAIEALPNLNISTQSAMEVALENERDYVPNLPDWLSKEYEESISDYEVLSIVEILKEDLPKENSPVSRLKIVKRRLEAYSIFESDSGILRMIANSVV